MRVAVAHSCQAQVDVIYARVVLMKAQLVRVAIMGSNKIGYFPEESIWLLNFYLQF